MGKSQTVTSSQFQEAIADYGDAAKDHPVVVTRQDQPWFVLLSPEDYARLSAYDTRQALYPHELDDEMSDALDKAEMDARHNGLNVLMD